MNTTFSFSAGVWNINRGEDPFGPPARPSVPFADKLTALRDLGFEYVQFHDDDAVPLGVSPIHIPAEAARIRALCDDTGLKVEFARLKTLWPHSIVLSSSLMVCLPTTRTSGSWAR